MYSYTGRGYFQDDVWELYYLKNIEDKVENIDYFLEHTVTAYYRGSLEEIAIYDKNEEFVECFVYDRELTFKESPENYVNENVDDIRNSFFVDIETAYMLENSEIEVTKELIEELWEVPKEEREEFLFEGKEKRIKKSLDKPRKQLYLKKSTKKESRLLYGTTRSVFCLYDFLNLL